jgi:hypothetical protein
VNPLRRCKALRDRRRLGHEMAVVRFPEWAKIEHFMKVAAARSR